jgi:hypothetical protein
VIAYLVEVPAGGETNTKAAETQVAEACTADVLAFMSAMTASDPPLEDVQPNVAQAFQRMTATRRMSHVAE